MAKIVTKSVAPIYAVGIFWLAWSLVLPLYAPLHFAAAAVCSVAAFAVGKLIWRNRTLVVPDPRQEATAPTKTAPTPGADSAQKAEAPKAEAKNPERTGNPELDALILERDRAISEMRRLNDSIRDEKISAQIDHMESVTQKIVAHVLGTPAKLPQIRRFLSYYLPTTLKLLNAYDRMDSAGVSGANIDGTMGKIEAMMETIGSAFDRQLDALFGDEALDISTDITVLEQMLAREGIGGIQLDANG